MKRLGYLIAFCSALAACGGVARCLDRDEEMESPGAYGGCGDGESALLTTGALVFEPMVVKDAR